MKTFLKDPDDTLDYKFDYAALTNGTGDTDWLGSGETIASATITVDSPGPTVEKSSITDSSTSVTVWVSGGTAGKTYKLACKITTNNSPVRIAERTIALKVIQR